MAELWHDINDPGFFRKPKSDNNNKTKYEPSEEPSASKKSEPIATLFDAKFIPPENGLNFNDKCCARVSVKYKEETSQKKVIFKLFCNYNNTSQDLRHNSEAFENNGIAETTLQLFYPDDYTDGSVDYYFTAEHVKGDKPVQSEILTLPYSKAKKLILRFELPQDDEIIKNDILIFFDKDKKYNIKKSIKDGTKNNNFYEFEFTDIPQNTYFSLELDPQNKEEKIIVFEDLEL
jgi:hypothetical protein